jgi:hypothetical protein
MELGTPTHGTLGVAPVRRGTVRVAVLLSLRSASTRDARGEEMALIVGRILNSPDEMDWETSQTTQHFLRALSWLLKTPTPDLGGKVSIVEDRETPPLANAPTAHGSAERHRFPDPLTRFRRYRWEDERGRFLEVDVTYNPQGQRTLIAHGDEIIWDAHRDPWLAYAFKAIAQAHGVTAQELQQEWEMEERKKRLHEETLEEAL